MNRFPRLTAIPLCPRLTALSRLTAFKRLTAPLYFRSAGSEGDEQMPILVMGEQWGDMILDGHKSIELRGKKNVKHANARVKVGVKGQC